MTKASWPKIWNTFERTHTFITWTSHTSSRLIRSKLDELEKWLVKAKGGKPQGTTTIKAIWKAGDLKPKLERWNRNIGRMRARWQVRNVLLSRRWFTFQAGAYQRSDGRRCSGYEVANVRPARPPGQDADECNVGRCRDGSNREYRGHRNALAHVRSDTLPGRARRFHKPNYESTSSPTSYYVIDPY